MTVWLVGILGFVVVMALWGLERRLKAIQNKLHHLDMQFRETHRLPPFDKDHSEGEWRYQQRNNSN